jgi:hypothetical protein
MRGQRRQSLECCSSRSASLGYVLLQDASFRSITVGSEPQLDDFDTLLTAYSLGLDKLPLPYLSGGVPALLTGFFQLPTPVVVVCPIIDPSSGCIGCRFSMPDRVVAGQSSSPVDAARTPV